MKTPRDELVETIMDLVNQFGDRDKDRYPDCVGHVFLSALEGAFDVLESEGKLEYIDDKEYWGKLNW